LPVLGHFIPASFVQRSIDQAGKLGHFDPDGASPLSAISQTRARILLIHGQSDAHIAAAQSIALHAAAPARSELILVEGEDHFSIATDRTKTIQTRGMQWLHRWLDAHTN
jgi:dipeptidyl aminopeptidase/acylaminoacyl peptidase